MYVIKYSVLLCVCLTYTLYSYTLFATPVYVITSDPLLCCKPLMFLDKTYMYVLYNELRLVPGFKNGYNLC